MNEKKAGFMGLQIDKTIKLDHLFTLFGIIFALGVFYATMNMALDTKADKSETIVLQERVKTNRENIMVLRRDQKDQFDRIEAHLIRIERQVQNKVSK